MHGDVGAGVTRGLEEIRGPLDIQARDLAQVTHRRLLVPRRGIEPRTDGRGTQVDLQKQVGVVDETLDLLIQEHGEGLELLPQAHRHRILQLGAPHFEHVSELP